MIHTISGFIALLYTSPPASGIQYLASIGKRLNIVHPTYAQEEGPGFEKMKAYREIWKAFRNLSYVFFVLILVFMGFAIMFRVKINPQTVITIQSALPKVVIALILITFSYAIVGLLIDFMFVAVNLILFTFGDLMGFTVLAEKLGYDLAITSSAKAFGVLLLAGFFPSLVIMMFFLFLPALFGGILGIIFTGTTGGTSLLAAGAIDLAIILILAFVFLIALIRVLWSLLKAYVMVVINLIFAPFQILIGVLPGSNAIGNWFKNLIANLAVFPAVLTMVLLSYYIVYHGLNLIFMPFLDFFMGDKNITEFMNAIGDIAGDLGEMTILCFVSLGVLLMAPKVADMIKAFFAGKPFEYGTAIGEAMGPAITGAGFVTTGGIGIGAERMRRRYGPDTWQRRTIETIADTMQKWASRGFKS